MFHRTFVILQLLELTSRDFANIVYLLLSPRWSRRQLRIQMRPTLAETVTRLVSSSMASAFSLSFSLSSFSLISCPCWFCFHCCPDGISDDSLAQNRISRGDALLASNGLVHRIGEIVILRIRGMPRICNVVFSVCRVQRIYAYHLWLH